MEYSKKGLAVTERFEGCRLHAYPDCGAYSIGYGHRGIESNAVCTKEQAEAWLHEDIKAAVDFINRAVTISLTQGEFDALVDFTYNVGVGNFQNSTLLRMLNAGNFKGAAEQFERWDKAGGNILPGLLGRRQAEEAEFVAIDPEIAQG